MKKNSSFKDRVTEGKQNSIFPTSFLSCSSYSNREALLIRTRNCEDRKGNLDTLYPLLEIRGHLI
jgi:hypothetical protein